MTHRIAFRGFDPDGEGRIYEHGILPHWRQDGCSYFVTFRQSDSLPIAVVREMEASRHRWLGQRGVDLSQTDWKQHFATLPATVREEYERFNGSMLENHLDNCHGSCALRDAKNAQVVEAALNHFHETRVQMGDFVIMPNHVHAILRPVEGFELEQILHSIKSFTANKINQLTNRKGEFWQRQSFDHIVRDFDELEAYQKYIAQNPAKAGLSEGQYRLQVASWYPDEP